MRKSLVRIFLIAGILAATVACDQTTKHMARSSLRNTGVVNVLGDFFILTYAENPGAFLSLGSKWNPLLRSVVFGVFPLIVVAGVALYTIRTKRMSLLLTGVLSLMLGGGIGNLIDRLTRGGYVTDFMNMGIGRVRTGIFNFADVFLMAGMFVFLLAGTRKQKSR